MIKKNGANWCLDHSRSYAQQAIDILDRPQIYFASNEIFDKIDESKQLLIKALRCIEHAEKAMDGVKRLPKEELSFSLKFAYD